MHFQQSLDRYLATTDTSIIMFNKAVYAVPKWPMASVDVQNE